MTAHELARMLLEVPDSKVYINVDALVMYATTIGVEEDEDGDVIVMAQLIKNVDVFD